MTDKGAKNEQMQIAIDIFIKLGLLTLIVYISYLIVKAFLPMILWGIILAVAFSPAIDMLSKRFGNRKKIIIATALFFIAILAVSSWQLSGSLIESSQSLVESFNRKEIVIPMPSERVKEWPIIGDEAYKLWQSAHDDLPKTLEPFRGQIKKFVFWLISMLKGALGTVLVTIASIAIAALFLISRDRAVVFYKRIMRRVLGERGDEWAQLSAITVRSVAMGVVGVAVIQSAMALLGMLIAGIPLAPVWALLIMFLTIIQMPALIIIGPMIAYEFSITSGTPAAVFAIYMLAVGASDGVLKPMLMGRGVDIPMLVILVGAIGGMMLMGMIGLFLGAVILALAYKLFELWVAEADSETLQAAGVDDKQ